MHSTITSKYQTTIPKQIREKLNLSVKDILEWRVVDGEIIIVPSDKSKFLNYRNTIKTGPGNIIEDIQEARRLIAKRHK